ncbi:MAG TPA: hypothetical protein VK635_07780 [Bradyrhizobium sp.]|jgi:hypothetical protein|nr:hypothetical protein [Bradyrhizobium sp.]
MSIVAAETVVEGAATAAKVGFGGLSWLPWAIATGLLAIGAGGTLWYRSQWESCQASVAIEAAKAQAMVNAQKDADAKFTAGLEAKLAPLTKQIQDSNNATQLALAKVKSVAACSNTPAAAAFDANVLPNGAAQAPASPARPAGP